MQPKSYQSFFDVFNAIENDEAEYDEVDRSSVCKNITGMCCNTQHVVVRKETLWKSLHGISIK